MIGTTWRSVGKQWRRLIGVVAGLASATLPLPAGAQTLKASYDLPFVLTNNHLLISAKVNGQGPYTFILDTGSQVNILSSAVAAELKLPVQSAAPVNGLGAQTLTAQQTQTATITVGTAPLPNQTFLILDSALAVVKTDRPVQGVIGLPLLQQYALGLNISQNHAELIARSPSGSGPSDLYKPQVLPLTFEESGIALLSATLNGVQGNFEVDTGSNATLILYPQFAAAHPQQIAVPAAKSSSSQQIGGAFSMTTIDRADFAIGPCIGTLSPLLVAATTPAQAVGKDIAGNIGMAVLRNLNMVLDYSNRTLTVASPLERESATASSTSQTHS